MNKLIVANWKSNPNTASEAIKLAEASDFKNVVIAPPYPYLEQVGKLIKKASLGAQDVFQKDGGPYTGEVSLSQLRDLKVKYVIVGHSERRKHLGESDEVINQKVKLVLSGRLKVILCVGEDWLTRRKGITAAKNFVANQLKKDLSGNRKREAGSGNLFIAYEPIWAISSVSGNRADTPQDAAEVMKFIKRVLNTRYKVLDTKVLYGGSVDAKNADAFLNRKEIDGALVGNASLSSQSFKAIIKARDSV